VSTDSASDTVTTSTGSGGNPSARRERFAAIATVAVNAPDDCAVPSVARRISPSSRCRVTVLTELR